LTSLVSSNHKTLYVFPNLLFLSLLFVLYLFLYYSVFS
jgi:hypothetical protein